MSLPFPEPPWTVSPKTLSLPLLAVRTSLPVSPTRTSLPLSPSIESSPPPPQMKSSPFCPTFVSLPFDPRMTSGSFVPLMWPWPLIVTWCPKHVCALVALPVGISKTAPAIAGTIRRLRNARPSFTARMGEILVLTITTTTSVMAGAGFKRIIVITAVEVVRSATRNLGVPAQSQVVADQKVVADVAELVVLAVAGGLHRARGVAHDHVVVIAREELVVAGALGSAEAGVGVAVVVILGLVGNELVPAGAGGDAVLAGCHRVADQEVRVELRLDVVVARAGRLGRAQRVPDLY